MKHTGFVNKENVNLAGNWSLGLLQMDFFYRYKPWYAGQFVRKIIPKFKLNRNSILFFTTILNKQKRKLLSVLVRDVDKVFLNTEVLLPILDDGNIDLDFIDMLISEIEAERISKLDNYLSSNGLKDFMLNDKEKYALESFNNLEWKVFKLEELFGKSTRGKRLKSSDRISGKLPFVTAGEAEQGVSDFIGNDVTIFSENTITIDMFGSAKYRNYKYGGDDHVAIVHTNGLSKFESIFVTSAIHKSSYNGQFDYGRNFYAKDADTLNILLPTKNLKPDYPMMSNVVSAVHKLVVKELILYSEKMMDCGHK